MDHGSEILYDATNGKYIQAKKKEKENKNIFMKKKKNEVEYIWENPDGSTISHVKDNSSILNFPGID